MAVVTPCWLHAQRRYACSAPLDTVDTTQGFDLELVAHGARCQLPQATRSSDVVLGCVRQNGRVNVSVILQRTNQNTCQSSSHTRRRIYHVLACGHANCCCFSCLSTIITQEHVLVVKSGFECRMQWCTMLQSDDLVRSFTACRQMTYTSSPCSLRSVHVHIVVRFRSLSVQRTALHKQDFRTSNSRDNAQTLPTHTYQFTCQTAMSIS